MPRWRPGLVATWLLVAAACAPVPPPSTTSPATTAPVSTTRPAPVVSGSLPPESPDTGDVEGFEVAEVVVDGRRLLVAVASSPADHARGLMGVVDFGDLDGMLFVFDPPRPVAFWMKDTPVPLHVGYFDADGKLFQVESMNVCPDGNCPTYPSSGPVRWALEIPRDRPFPAMGSTLAVVDD